MTKDDTTIMDVICQYEQCRWNSFPKDILKNHIENFKYCPFCGILLTWKCSKCNTRILDANAVYCRHCGCKFGGYQVFS